MVRTEVLERIGNTIVSRLNRNDIRAKATIYEGTLAIKTPEDVNEFNSIAYEIDDKFLYNGKEYTIASEKLERLRDPTVFDGREVYRRYNLEIKQL